MLYIGICVHAKKCKVGIFGTRHVITCASMITRSFNVIHVEWVAFKYTYMFFIPSFLRRIVRRVWKMLRIWLDTSQIFKQWVDHDCTVGRTKGQTDFSRLIWVRKVIPNWNLMANCKKWSNSLSITFFVKNNFTLKVIKLSTLHNKIVKIKTAELNLSE